MGNWYFNHFVMKTFSKTWTLRHSNICCDHRHSTAITLHAGGFYCLDGNYAASLIDPCLQIPISDIGKSAIDKQTKSDVI
eukprot:scaffold320623_cov59-Attheya_sp.AAC.4